MATEKYQNLLAQYRQLAKRADQRLLRLERYADEGGKWKGAKKYAYANAMRDIHTWSGSDAKRFNTKAPANYKALERKVADIQRFLDSVTSTVGSTPFNRKSGIANVYQRRVETINKKYGTNFTWQDLGEFFESSLNKKLDARLDAYTKLYAIGVIQDNKDEIVDKLKNHQPIHIKLDDEDPVLEDQVNHILRYYKKDVKKLLKG